MELRNTSPLGDLEIVGVGLVEAGATFEAPDEIAKSLLEQGFEPAKKAAKATASKEKS